MRLFSSSRFLGRAGKEGGRGGGGVEGVGSPFIWVWAWLLREFGPRVTTFHFGSNFGIISLTHRNWIWQLGKFVIKADSFFHRQQCAKLKIPKSVSIRPQAVKERSSPLNEVQNRYLYPPKRTTPEYRVVPHISEIFRCEPISVSFSNPPHSIATI